MKKTGQLTYGKKKMMSSYSDEKCPSCGTEAIYKIAENSFGCKCTYEFELEIQLSMDEIIAMVKQVRKEMAEERDKESRSD